MKVFNNNDVINCFYGTNKNNDDLFISVYKKNEFICQFKMSETEQHKLAGIIIERLDIKKITRKMSVKLE